MVRRLGKEAGYLLLFLLLVVLLVPVFIVLSIALFQSMDEAMDSATLYLANLKEGLLAGDTGSWSILLGPYAVFLVLRTLAWAWRSIREKTRRRRVEWKR